MNWAFLDTNEGTVLYSWGGGGGQGSIWPIAVITFRTPSSLFDETPPLLAMWFRTLSFGGLGVAHRGRWGCLFYIRGPIYL